MKWTKFLKTRLPKLNQGEIHNLKSPIAIKEIVFIILNLSLKKPLSPGRFNKKFYQAVNEKLTPILWCNCFLKIVEKRILLKSFYEASIALKRASQVVLVVKNPPANAGDIRDGGLIRGSGRSPGGGHGNPLHYSCLENPMDRGAWRAVVHGVTESWT